MSTIRSSLDGALASASARSSRSGRGVDRAPECACGFSFGTPRGEVYNEAAFRYFLDLERKRASASNQRFVLLLADMNRPSGRTTSGNVQVAQKLIAALADCVRETDFVGWYQEGIVAGAVLTQRADHNSHDVDDAAGARVARRLAERLPSAIAAMVRVRWFESPAGLPNVS